MDAMGMGLCVAFIAFVRLPSLKVSTLLLSGLLLYDVFWVFFSQYVFNANVMVSLPLFYISPSGFSGTVFSIILRPFAVIHECSTPSVYYALGIHFYYFSMLALILVWFP